MMWKGLASNAFPLNLNGKSGAVAVRFDAPRGSCPGALHG